jgi:hypothetical protein
VYGVNYLAIRVAVVKILLHQRNTTNIVAPGALGLRRVTRKIRVEMLSLVNQGGFLLPLLLVTIIACNVDYCSAPEENIQVHHSASAIGPLDVLSAFLFSYYSGTARRTSTCRLRRGLLLLLLRPCIDTLLCAVQNC